MILQKRKFEPVSNFIVQYHWLDIEKRILFKNLTIIFKSIHEDAPVPIFEMIDLRDDNSLKLKDTGFHPKTCLGNRAFTFYAPRIWNALPLQIRSSASVETFKKSLKTFLFTDFEEYKQQVNRIIKII